MLSLNTCSLTPAYLLRSLASSSLLSPPSFYLPLSSFFLHLFSFFLPSSSFHFQSSSLFFLFFYPILSQSFLLPPFSFLFLSPSSFCPPLSFLLHLHLETFTSSFHVSLFLLRLSRFVFCLLFWRQFEIHWFVPRFESGSSLLIGQFSKNLFRASVHYFSRLLLLFPLLFHVLPSAPLSYLFYHFSYLQGNFRSIRRTPSPYSACVSRHSGRQMGSERNR